MVSNVRAQLRAAVAAPPWPPGRHLASGRAIRQDPGAAAVPVAGRRRRRRHDRHSCAVAPQSAGGPTLFLEVVETTGLCPATTNHRQAAQLSRRLPHRDAIRGPLHGPVREQSGGSLPPTDPAAGASDAPIQICCPRATVSLGPRPHPESLSGRPPSAPSGSPPVAQNACVPHLG
jgi:hypothetical protein